MDVPPRARGRAVDGALSGSRLDQERVDHPILDTGQIADVVREIVPERVHAALELIGTPTLPDTLRATCVHGVLLFTGILSDSDGQGFLADRLHPARRPADRLRRRRRPSPAVLQKFLDDVVAGRLNVPIHKAYHGLDRVPEAHSDMEAGTATGKLVVLQ